FAIPSSFSLPNPLCPPLCYLVVLSPRYCYISYHARLLLCDTSPPTRASNLDYQIADSRCQSVNTDSSGERFILITIAIAMLEGIQLFSIVASWTQWADLRNLPARLGIFGSNAYIPLFSRHGTELAVSASSIGPQASDPPNVEGTSPSPTPDAEPSSFAWYFAKGPLQLAVVVAMTFAAAHRVMKMIFLLPAQLFSAEERDCEEDEARDLEACRRPPIRPSRIPRWKVKLPVDGENVGGTNIISCESPTETVSTESSSALSKTDHDQPNSTPLTRQSTIDMETCPSRPATPQRPSTPLSISTECHPDSRPSPSLSKQFVPRPSTPTTNLSRPATPRRPSTPSSTSTECHPDRQPSPSLSKQFVPRPSTPTTNLSRPATPRRPSTPSSTSTECHPDRQPSPSLSKQFVPRPSTPTTNLSRPATPRRPSTPSSTSTECHPDRQPSPSLSKQFVPRPSTPTTNLSRPVTPRRPSTPLSTSTECHPERQPSPSLSKQLAPRSSTPTTTRLSRPTTPRRPLSTSTSTTHSSRPVTPRRPSTPLSTSTSTTHPSRSATPRRPSTPSSASKECCSDHQFSSSVSKQVGPRPSRSTAIHPSRPTIPRRPSTPSSASTESHCDRQPALSLSKQLKPRPSTSTTMHAIRPSTSRRPSTPLSASTEPRPSTSTTMHATRPSTPRRTSTPLSASTDLPDRQPSSLSKQLKLRPSASTTSPRRPLALSPSLTERRADRQPSPSLSKQSKSRAPINTSLPARRPSTPSLSQLQHRTDLEGPIVMPSASTPVHTNSTTRKSAVQAVVPSPSRSTMRRASVSSLSSTKSSGEARGKVKTMGELLYDNPMLRTLESDIEPWKL
ncbi:hypothetical protein BC938DRAFT_482105, partial [Jimgerdemannia flammicorona]